MSDDDDDWDFSPDAPSGATGSWLAQLVLVALVVLLYLVVRYLVT